MLERDYQAQLIKRLRVLFPGCVILKNDPNYLQGIPDLVIFYEDRYAFLEVKADERSPLQVNQDFYLLKLAEMSFAEVIYPSNEEAVVRELQQALEPDRDTRLPKR